ncbi:MAG TPA: ion transporter [Candidatus Acidoferrales bacterium]|nr:ion transporter [Candidatus Acidoferrales bacterium]
MTRASSTAKIAAITESAPFRRLVTTLILLNAILVGLETYPEVRASYGSLLHAADRAILYLFALELGLRLIAANGAAAFFRSGWNVFDLVIVAASFLPSSQFFTVARLFRILRVLRAVSVMAELQRLVGALLLSLPSLGHISALLALLIYVYAAVGTSLFAEFAPDHFGTLHQSVLTLFSVITLEGWIDVMDKVLPHAPLGWIYFVSFILLGTFVAMNFFVGVIVNNLQSVAVEERDDLAEIRAALSRLEARLEAAPRGDGRATGRESLPRAT